MLGIDVSAPMLARAREHLAEIGMENVDLVEADASTYAFDGRADLIFSRCGVMFFADPIAAFANLGRALRPGGRMVFVCFRARELNGWMTLPMAAAATIVPLEPPPAPGTPGPFSLADKERLHAILDSAGFIDVVCTPFDRDLVLGKDVDEATEFSIAAGPTARLLLDATDEVRTRVRTAVKNALAQYAGASGVALPSAAWIVRATNPLLAA